jgi:WhiB family redox-sensing transcriptional regulator
VALAFSDEDDPDPVTLWLMAPGAPELLDLETVTARPAWMAQGACRGTATAMFFTELGGDVRPAKALCAECPVRVECLDYAVADSSLEGIWGGVSARRRAKLRRAKQ